MNYDHITPMQLLRPFTAIMAIAANLFIHDYCQKNNKEQDQVLKWPKFDFEYPNRMSSDFENLDDYVIKFYHPVVGQYHLSLFEPLPKFL